MSDYVVIVDRSAGNESVGEMWKETRVFPPDATIKEAMDWAETRSGGGALAAEASRCNVTLTRAWADTGEEV